MSITINKQDLRRSPFFYVGDKFKLISQLKTNFPNNIHRFIEPFCGGGSVFLNIKANKYLLNDIDKHIIELHKFLKSYANSVDDFWIKIKELIDYYNLSATYIDYNVPENLRKEFVKTYFAKYNKEAYYKMRLDYNETQDIHLLYLLLIYGFNRFLRFNSKGEFNLPVGNVDFNKNVKEALEGYFIYINNKDVEFYSMDFEDFIKLVQPQTNDFIYLDPPYLITSSEYNKLWNEENEVRLINFLDKLHNQGIRFAISNILWHKKKHNEIFNEWSQKYNTVHIKSNYISFNDNKIKDSCEVLVKNY